MAKDVAFEVADSGPTVQLWVNNLMSIQFHSATELETFAKDILGMLPELIEAQAQR